MNSEECKLKLLHYFRFFRKYNYIATEVGKFNSDVLVSNGESIIEIEVKISYADLKNELKKQKHKNYISPTKWYKQYLPNYYYFAIPEVMKEKASKYIYDNFPIYGLIIIKDLPIKRKISSCEIIKRPKSITDNFSVKLQYQLLLRMGSELIRGKLNGKN